MELDKIGVNDIIDTVSKLVTLEEASKRVEKKIQDCESQLNRQVAKIDISAKVEIEVDVEHIIDVDCIDGVSIVDHRVRYVLKNNMLEPLQQSTTTVSPPKINFSKLTLRDVVTLTLYEKYDNLLTNLVKKAEECDKGLAESIEILKTVAKLGINLMEEFEQ